jgi:UDP-N-acetylmuramate--alanine ligase
MADVERAFVEFIDRVPFYGAVTACIDNALLKGILPRVRRRVFTYGVAAEADFRLEILDAGRAPDSESGPGTELGTGQGSSFSRFQVHTAAGPLGPFELHVPGRHNVLNATAAVAIARQLEVPPAKIAEGLKHFRGVDRRFQRRGAARGVTVVDDYGHHPTEIRATLEAARASMPMLGRGKIHVIFQPHRFSRTLDLLDEFSGAFKDADTVVVLPIYAASEEPIAGVTAERLAELIQGPRVAFEPDFAAAVAAVTASTQPGDLILTLGAGSVSQLAPQILAALEGVL